MTNLIAAFHNFANELTKSKQKIADGTKITQFLANSGQKFWRYFKGYFNFPQYLKIFAHDGGRAVEVVGLHPLAC
jgi:hypothetical protein